MLVVVAIRRQAPLPARRQAPPPKGGRLPVRRRTCIRRREEERLTMTRLPLWKELPPRRSKGGRKVHWLHNPGQALGFGHLEYHVE